ncbi:MAG: hypothetical protein HY275_05160 [Gemmatimonadetes bacterium]|nr:hypothetical protein [Gemmatimonadota bacterium]
MTGPERSDPDDVPRWWWAGLAVLLVAAVASAGSLGNGFAMDDVPIIQTNGLVHDAAHWWHRFAESYWPRERGGGLFRPLTMLAYTGLWAVGQGAPAPFHWANVALYALLCLAVLRLARVLLPEGGAVAAALLFAAHPVHVEAVANAVGLAEMLASLPMLLAAAWYIERRRRGALAPRDVAILAALYAVACLAKEHGAMLPLLLLVAEAILLPAEPGKWRRLVPLGVAFTVVAAGYLVARQLALAGVNGEFPHVVWATSSVTTRHLTMLGVSLEWLRLLFWPATLSAEYSPPAIRVITGWSWTLVPAVALVYGVKSVAVFGWRRWPLPAFACAWLVITLFPVSNTLVVAGLILAERTLLVPSVAAVLLVGWTLEALVRQVPAADRRRARALAGTIALLLVALGTWRSSERGPVWKDNGTLFAQTVRDLPDAYRAHYHLGAWYLDHDQLPAAERELRAAIALYKLDYEPRAFLAEAYRKHDLCPPALALYREALAIVPRAGLPRAGYVACLIGMAQYDSARAIARRGIGQGPAPRLRRACAAPAPRTDYRQTMYSFPLTTGIG